MRAAGQLPKFRRPPLIEVVHGIQFQPLPFNTTHPGLFYLRIKDRYPSAQSVAPLAPVRESLDPATPILLQLTASMAGGLPRSWFASDDDVMLVQLQSDRLILNWRKGAGEAEYPHFDAVSAEFQRVYHTFETFVEEVGLGQIAINQCEMTYINHLHPTCPAGTPLDPTKHLRIWSNAVGDDWGSLPDDYNLAFRYTLKDTDSTPYGRLIATVSTLAEVTNGERLLQFELTARGIPIGTGLDGSLSFHKMAHENIVRCFAGLTTSGAHELWDRWQ